MRSRIFWFMKRLTLWGVTWLRVLRRALIIDEAGDALIVMIRRTAKGRTTAAEALGHREVSMTKLHRSA